MTMRKLIKLLFIAALGLASCSSQLTVDAPNIIEHSIIGHSIIGHWEIDYKTFKAVMKKIKHVTEKENSFDFYNNGNYKRLIWGFESGGCYTN